MDEPNWENLRKYLTVQLEHLMMSTPVGDMLIEECPKCGQQVPFVVETVRSIEQILDLIMPHYRKFYQELAFKLDPERILYAKELRSRM